MWHRGTYQGLTRPSQCAFRCALLLLALAIVCAPHAAKAQTVQQVKAASSKSSKPVETRWPNNKSLHIFSGSTVSRFSQGGYLGALVAPVEKLHKSGFRLRFEASGGLFQYQTDIFNGIRQVSTTIDGTGIGGRAHIGYVVINPRWGGGLFLGADVSHTETTPNDPGNEDIGTEVSTALRLEGYAKPTEHLLVSGQVSLKRDFQNGFARGAISVPIGWGIRVGPEVLAIFADEFLEMRYGAEVLFPLRNSRKMAITCGYAMDSDDRQGAYGGVHFKWDY